MKGPNPTHTQEAANTSCSYESATANLTQLKCNRLRASLDPPLSTVYQLPSAMILVHDTVDPVSDKITIGRSTKMVDIVLDLTPTNTISRRHAEITRTQGGEGGKCFVIKDLVRTRTLERNTTCPRTRNFHSKVELALHGPSCLKIPRGDS